MASTRLRWCIVSCPSFLADAENRSQGTKVARLQRVAGDDSSF